MSNLNCNKLIKDSVFNENINSFSLPNHRSLKPPLEIQQTSSIALSDIPTSLGASNKIYQENVLVSKVSIIVKQIILPTATYKFQSSLEVESSKLNSSLASNNLSLSENNTNKFNSTNFLRTKVSIRPKISNSKEIIQISDEEDESKYV